MRASGCGVLGSFGFAMTYSEPQKGQRTLRPDATKLVVAPQFWQVKLVASPDWLVAVCIALGSLLMRSEERGARNDESASAAARSPRLAYPSLLAPRSSHVTIPAACRSSGRTSRR